MRPGLDRLEYYIMRKYLQWPLLILALGAAWFQWHTNKDQLRAAARLIHWKMFPCSGPVTYSVGSISLGYSLTPAELAGALKEAEAAFEAPARRNLLEYRESGGDVTVNMVYDNRQAALDKLAALGIKTEHSLASYQELKARYEELAARTEAEQARFADLARSFKRKETAYNAGIQRLNKLGTATHAEHLRARAARGALTQEFARLKKRERAVNADVDTLNALATTLNQLIVQLQLNVAQYNRAGSIIGRYEEGLYRSAAGRRSIDIYTYSQREHLVRLLAHELGHALGLDHTGDPESLMYPLNTGGTTELKPADIAELNRACRRH